MRRGDVYRANLNPVQGSEVSFGKDGNKWFVLFGEDLQVGQSFWGDSLVEAGSKMLHTWRREWHGRSEPLIEQAVKQARQEVFASAVEECCKAACDDCDNGERVETNSEFLNLVGEFWHPSVERSCRAAAIRAKFKEEKR